MRVAIPSTECDPAAKQRREYPEPIGDHDSHETLFKLLDRHPPGRALDVPTGLGGVAMFLKDRGWDVQCGDIDPGHFTLKDVPFARVDMNQKLPFQTGEFDLVACVNAVHRIYNMNGLFREFRRILKPGGTLYINVHNYADIMCRLRFLFTGSMDTKVNTGGALQTIDDPIAHVRIGVLYPQIATALEQSGFRIESVHRTSVRSYHRLLTPVAWLLRPFGWMVPAKLAKLNHVAAMNSSELCPGGRYVCIRAIAER